MIQDIFVIGATGKVGKTLVHQIVEKGDIDPSVHVNPTRVVGLASSTNFVYSLEGLSSSELYDFINRRYGQSQRYSRLDEFLEVVGNKHRKEKSALVFVDVTAVNEPMREFHLKIIRETGYGIVTANKNPVALSDYAVFKELTRDPRRYGYRCSVMAGAEAVPFLQDLKDLNDSLQSIEGCFSGTLGYITTELGKDRKFSEILKEAVEKGYTEPDPRDDLNGLDVARKLVVLTRTAGFGIGMEDIQVEPFIPQEYLLDESVSDFLEKSAELEGYFEKKVSIARKKGQSLRYVSRMDIIKKVPKIEVSLKEVPKESELGRLRGKTNKIVIISEAYPKDNSYVITAPGAGLLVTARNVRRDLLHLLGERGNVT